MDNSLHEKLKAIENSLPEIEKQLSQIDISNDQKGYAEMAKKHSDVSIIVDLFNQWKNTVEEIKDAEELMEVETDEDMKQDYGEFFAARYIIEILIDYRNNEKEASNG